MKKDIIATIGTYQKDGETKYISRKVGQLFEIDGKLKMKMDTSFNPAGCKAGEDGQIWLALFDPRPREGQQPAQQPQDLDDSSDIPF